MADGPDLSEIVRRTVQANARFYKGWMDLTFEYWRGISEILGGTPVSNAPVQEMDAGASAVVLEGEAGSVVRGSFLVSNDMEKPVSCAFSSSDFRDPRGSSVPAKASFEPAAVQLAPGEQRVVQVEITVDDALSAGVGHAGEIFINASSIETGSIRTAGGAGGQRFELTGAGSDAWARDRRMDAAIVAAMRSAATMTVNARDRTGRRFSDSYRLDGAATAMDAATVGCARLR